ncbi:MAG TPA: thymidine phosphorylase [Acidobacteriota bacterium]|nr:thymidine phosphorylase [Acidobacteriota bacterium]
MRTPVEINQLKRDGHTLSSEDITNLVNAYTRDEVPDYQIAAFLMAVCCRGMVTEEIQALTNAMLHSGMVLDFSDIPGIKVDKHSTGGVGDKTSLVLAPLVAAAGIPVPMISGRGLGHSGGTLDKLESIPGFQTGLPLTEFRRLLSTIGVGLIGQTLEIAPADRKLYALRGATGTVESVPLITGSIMSKKLAEGIDALVLDVKCGNGAFMKTTDRALELARSLIATGEGMGKQVTALVTDMNQPLGWSVGNGLEVIEAQEMLRGNLVGRFAQLTLELAAHMIQLGSKVPYLKQARDLAVDLITSGKAMEKWQQIIEAQGGDPRVTEDETRLPQAAHQKIMRAEQSGILTAIETEAVGWASLLLGAGRLQLSSPIDPAVGIRIHVERGAEMKAGDPLCTLYYNDSAKLALAEERLKTVFTIVPGADEFHRTTLAPEWFVVQ